MMIDAIKQAGFLTALVLALLLVWAVGLLLLVADRVAALRAWRSSRLASQTFVSTSRPAPTGVR